MENTQQACKSILLIVDVQVGVMHYAWDAVRIIENLRVAVEKARSAGVPVLWVQHADDELITGSPEWQIVPDLKPAPGETVIHKHFNSSFEETPLVDILTKLGATHIVLAGAATNWCIRATAYGALDRGYNLTLIKDAHSTESIQFKDGTIIEAADIIRELNVAITWLSYPGRSNGTVLASEVDFSLPEPNR